MHKEMHLLRVLCLLAHVFAVNKNILNSWLFDLDHSVWITAADYKYIFIKVRYFSLASAADWQTCLVM
jgi:hypothetical protein